MPSLDLRFAESKSLIDAVSGRQLVTFTRASSGTFIGSDGLIKTAAVNEPRFTHDPVTGESLGLLVEEQRTNLVLNSATFQPTSGGGPAAYAVDQVAPDGTTTGSRQTAATPRTLEDYTGIANALYTFSFYCRVTSGTAAFSIQIKNAVTDTVIANDTTPVATTTWKRFAISGTTTGATPGVRVELTGIEPGFVFWGAQLEAGDFATSHIPTTTATATRSADVVSIEGVNFSSWYRQDEGTLLIDSAIDYTVPAGRFPRVASLIGTPSSNTIQCAFQTADNAGFEVTVAGSSQVGLSLPVDALRRRLAITCRADDFAACVNGGAVSADTAGIVPIVNNLRIGDRFGNSTLNGPIRRLPYWPHRLDNNTLQELTR
jgi:hypothetical protein